METLAQTAEDKKAGQVAAKASLIATKESIQATENAYKLASATNEVGNVLVPG